jgi:hypothetical protein
MITIRPYCPVSFWTKAGAARLYRRFVAWGLPDLKNWRMITLTIDRNEYPDAESAYELGKLYVSDFRTAFKAMYPHEEQFTKFELHEADKEDGQVYPHWHLLLNWKRQVDFVAVAGMWRMGRVKVQRVEDEGYDYLFKYVSKSVEHLPYWLKKRRVVRAWSASKGFFLHRVRPKKTDEDVVESLESDNEDVERGESLDDYVEVAPGVFARDVPVERNESPTLGERLEKWARTVQITEEKPDGTIRGYLRVTTCASWGQFLAKVAQEKLSRFLGSLQLTVSEKEILCLKISNLPSLCLLYS